jgi:NTE family protein
MNEFDKITEYLNIDEEGKKLITKLDNIKAEDKQYSDVLDENGNQYIDLVQEGGGTLGLSLVGFCFVLEFVGIRFLRLAGTSAGAINTLFLAALGNNKSETKTPKLFEILQNMKMHEFIDGHWFFRAMIKSIISKNDWFLYTIVIYIFISFLLIFYFPLILQYSSFAQKFYYFFFIIFLVVTVLFGYMYFKFKKANYGINKGEEFEIFIKENLDVAKINNQADLDSKAKFKINAEENTYKYTFNNKLNNETSITFKLRETSFAYKIDSDNEIENRIKEVQASFNNYIKINNIEDNSESIKKIEKDTKDINESNEKIEKDTKENNIGLKGISADYTFITIDLASQNKIELPKQAAMFWKNPKETNPAQYVRASMSIPIFFEPLFVPDKKSKKRAIFIDGGAISNFPISLFHNPNIIEPRLPTIGARINDSKEKDNSEINNLIQYIGKIFNVLKSNYDKDFLSKNKFYEEYSIANINTYETKANWLDFYMNEENKRALFLKGVEAGIEYLTKLDWEKYKKQRKILYSESINNS